MKFLLASLIALGPCVLLFVLSHRAAVEAGVMPAYSMLEFLWGSAALFAFLGALVWPFLALGVGMQHLKKGAA